MRYLALTQTDRKKMLESIGVNDVDHLFDSAPNQFLLKEPISKLPNHKSEIEVEKIMQKLSAKNRTASQGAFFLGAGCYKHHIPATVDHLIQRSEFLTSYTPYQPEISQGTLATIFQFQSIISTLTGMQVANASMYDGATSLAEACLMALRIKSEKKNIALIGNSIENKGSIHPDYLAVCKTYLDLNDAKLVDIIDNSCAAVLVQYPDFYGQIADLAAIRRQCDEVGALLIVAVNEIVALGLINAPEMSDIVVGEASSIGVGLNFGGPLLGFFACKKEFVRQMPGRICGATTDIDGKLGYVLTLNAREQHIRREKATSNICSNQGLCATAFTIHASLLGEIGFKKLALINHEKACQMADELVKNHKIRLINQEFFNEFTIELPIVAEIANKKLLEKNIIGGYAVGNKMIISATELTTDEDIQKLTSAFKEIL